MPEDLVGPWAQEKLERLRKYLSAYTTILRKQRFEAFYYIDAFAGPGAYGVRKKARRPAQQALLDVAEWGGAKEEGQAILEGSPRIALNLEFPFSAYVFLEKNPIRAAALQSLKSEYQGKRRIVIRKTECNRFLREKVADNSEIDWTRNRAFVFLDPFGMQVEWSTLESLGKTRAVEVLLNFPVGMAIQRLLLRKPENFSIRQRHKLDAYFGSPDWYSTIYKKQPSLFDIDAEGKVERSGKALLEWYRSRLKAAFGFVSKAALITNTRGGHLYYLVLATPNQTGAKIASDVLGAGLARD